MTKKKKDLTVILVVAAIFIVLIVFSILFGNKKINNPEGTVGNYRGNLNNGGYFCEYNQKIYFANSFDDYTLYSMNKDLSKLKKLTKVPVSQINVANGYIYFYQTDNMKGSDLGSLIRGNGIYRMKTDGSELKCLKKGVIGTMLLVEDHLYFQYYNSANQFTFCKMSVNGGAIEEIHDFAASPSSAADGNIYYNDVENSHNLIKYNTKNNTSTILYSGEVWFPVYSNGLIYFLDTDNNRRLCCLNLATASLKVLSEERIDYFAVGDSHVYYQTSSKSAPKLKRVSLDGSETETIADGVYTHLSVTSDYVYFTSYGDLYKTYRMSTYGYPTYDVFNEAMSAATD